MVGGGSVFLHAKSIRFAEKYWINDEFQELVSFWLSLQSPEVCGRLQRDLRKLHSSFNSVEEIKSYFYKVKDEIPTDDYRRAFLFFFFNRVTFSGTTRAGGFSNQAGLRRFTPSSIERLSGLSEALKNTVITQGDFEEVIVAPGKNVFIFLDPPYYTAKKLYGKNGSLHDFEHERLANVLQKSEHKFLITYDDCEEIRQLYSWANIQEWQLQYGMNNCNAANLSKVGNELFISNYRI